ncbi:hypothetical protein [Aliivibrio fischeri]|uniref:hypothetical protein n=1 Tax=Aliivibrio fischeri TaxID=668 RepID=UPI0012D8BD54|nr:hypothetical protein [Aliivibrio fischeri]MUK27376.1 hypothetical protein [Aliivibrio fischeri]MUK35219.1 hypothetical protein [Aliivibrio fischeri]
MSLEKNIISSLKGDFIWNGVKTEILLPLSILDLMCIHEKKYDEIINCIFSIINTHNDDVVNTIHDIMNHDDLFSAKDKSHINFDKNRT